MTATFGTIDNFGYEEAWEKDGIKVDIFSSIIEGKKRLTGFWVKEKLYYCSMPMEKVVIYKWRNEVEVKIPVPVKDAVLSMYGRNYPHPVDNWQWDVYPFLTGYCSYEYVS